MAFLTGRVALVRYQVAGARPRAFGPEHLEKLQNHVIATPRVANLDSAVLGWYAGDHILDTEFEQAKNVLGDYLNFALRVDQHRLPSDLLKAYAEIEIRAAARGNPSGFASRRQKQDAREAARERLQEEARDGRYLKRKGIPALWDANRGEVYFAPGAPKLLEQAETLFHETFGKVLARITAGTLAQTLTATFEPAPRIVDLKPAVFVPHRHDGDVVWSRDPSVPDFLGNEFLLWLWFTLETEGESITLGDGSEAAVMFSRSLVLECPQGLSGGDTLRSEGPTRLPEARRAVQSGKVPRQAGLTIARHDQVYELNLRAEALAYSGIKLPESEEADPRARRLDRLERLRDLIETVDLLYAVFLGKRCGAAWPEELERLQRWLRREERTRATA